MYLRSYEKGLDGEVQGLLIPKQDHDILDTLAPGLSLGSTPQSLCRHSAVVGLVNPTRRFLQLVISSTVTQYSNNS